MITECKCSTTVEALLDMEANSVICQSCGSIIEVTDFMKNMMKSNGDIIRRKNISIPEGGMLVECVEPKCHNKFAALLDKKDDKCYCPKCKTEVDLSVFSKALLRENGQYIGFGENANKAKPDASEEDIV